MHGYIHTYIHSCKVFVCVLWKVRGCAPTSGADTYIHTYIHTYTCVKYLYAYYGMPRTDFGRRAAGRLAAEGVRTPDAMKVAWQKYM